PCRTTTGARVCGRRSTGRAGSHDDGRCRTARSRQDFRREVLQLWRRWQAAGRVAPRPASADRIAAAPATVERAALGRFVCGLDRLRVVATQTRRTPVGSALGGVAPTRRLLSPLSV